MAKNSDIGRVRCPFTGETAPVRRNKNGRLYYLSSAGLICPSAADGQDWLLNHAEIWGEGGAPAEPSEPPPASVQPEPGGDPDADPNPVTVPDESEPAPSHEPAEAEAERPARDDRSPWGTIL